MRSSPPAAPGALALLAACALSGGCGGLRPVPVSPALPPQAGGAAAGELRIRRVDLSFEDGRPQATVPRNGRLRARALVHVDGSGTIQGAWLVDGTPVEVFTAEAIAGAAVELETGPATILPAHEPGFHALTLRFDAPAGAPVPPSIRYLVTLAEAPTDAAR